MSYLLRLSFIYVLTAPLLSLAQGQLKQDSLQAYYKKTTSLALTFARQEQYEAALPLFLKADTVFTTMRKADPRLKPANEVLFYKALSFDRTGDVESAEPIYKKLIEQHYPAADIYYNLAHIYRGKEAYDEAMEIIEKGRLSFPDDRLLLLQLAEFSLITGREGKLIKDLSQEVRKDGDNADIYFILAYVFESIDSLEEAERLYMETIIRDTTYREAYYNLAALYYNQAANLNKQLSGSGQNAERRNELLQQRDELYRMALPHLQKAAEMQYNQSKVQAIIGIIQARLRGSSPPGK